MYFWEKHKSNAKEISETLLLDPSTLTPLLKKLEAKNYVQITRSTTDGRNLEIEITEKGLDLRDQALTIPGEVSKCINLSKEEAETLYKLMYKILLNTQKED
jgi:DNA-binding MarR family transcriptional regulator